MRIFEHNHSINRCFSDEKDALDADVAGKYSILSHLNERRFITEDGFYHFILEYPQKNIFNSWKQLVNPYFDTDRNVSKNAYGYNYTDIQADVSTDQYSHFGGLVKDPYKHALLDGQPQHKDWCFAIGMYCNPDLAGTYLNNGIPGFCGYEPRVRLFARINSCGIKNSHHICYFSQMFGLFISSFYVFVLV